MISEERQSLKMNTRPQAGPSPMLSSGSGISTLTPKHTCAPSPQWGQPIVRVNGLA